MAKKIKYGIVTPNIGEFYGSIDNLVNISQKIEKAGWNGHFIWDWILGSKDPIHQIVDPWIALTAMASRTKKIKLGTTVTPIPRRRPWKLARETVSLDRFSKGRLILGVGLGFPPEEEFAAFGEESDIKIRAKKMDEGLDVLLGLWSGKKFSYNGEHYKIDNVTFLPKALQTPRIPVWGSGTWPYKKPFIRSAKLDGVVPMDNEDFFPTPKTLLEIISLIKEHRSNMKDFDIVASVRTMGIDSQKREELLSEYIDVGATWLVESIDESTDKTECFDYIEQGPPEI
ncbi:MAG: LLM class flavin-dependent oxidoreductase [Candidatus Heimdallarchaeota archaeon]|nr:LLM class flavin-dependent oxidoreductase [Candidatus Heimdallarchaeota archaeon]